ncbi:hypothetical protein DPMN_190017 [Dreissena polymorpha]|uniref:Uncharacterized protein n=1 Tax=Dreissena polymorpha TaxID=45954 RepID=A0A9D4DV45_DREPO|nr:hypothetical protein DPMN_190017 [Dreissena polymorpha]
MLPSFRIDKDQRGSFELPKTAVLATRSPKGIPVSPRTFTARHIATRRSLYSHAASSCMGL